MRDRTQELKDFLWFLAFCGMVAIAFRLCFGLGATTNLSDAVPWGLWKILNMVAGVALATCGFTIGLLVYVLKMEQFRPMVKPAILVAFLGYGSSVFALTLDIGLPHRIWHPIVMWNEHSFLFEVAWCVMLYFTVTIIELSPTVLERLKLKRFAGFLHRIAFGVVVVGISLSSLHHSSLGSLFLVTPQRLHPLWFTPRLPLLFIVSAMGTGLMVAVFAKLFYARLYDPESVFGTRTGRQKKYTCAVEEDAVEQGLDLPMLRQLATIGAAVLGVYLILKVADLFATGAITSLLTFSWESWFYLAELLTIAVLPVLFVSIPRIRRTPTGLGAAALSAAMGLILNRLNVGIFGYFRDAGTVYFPSLAEWCLSLGVIAAAGLVFLYMSENCAVFDDNWMIRHLLRARFVPSFDKFSGVWQRVLASGVRRISLIAVITLPMAWVFMYPPFFSKLETGPHLVKPPVAMDAERAVLIIDGNHHRTSVEFRHKEHQRRLGGDRSCNRCHHLSFPHDHSTPCSRCHQTMEGQSNIFDHTAHFKAVAEKERLSGLIPDNHSCNVCHAAQIPRTSRSARACLDCHRTDMAPAHDPSQPHDLAHALGYRAAMHKTCIECHKKEMDRVKRPALAECSTCHVPKGSDHLNKGFMRAGLE
ncbi:cytochrome c3 family protein [Acidobacteriota bacterium]